MASTQEDPPDDDYFNDLSRQPTRTGAEADQRRESQDDNSGSQMPKIKRIACVLCRKRKLKCDGNKPACGTCNRLQHDCSYDEVRRKSGPKRGYVKALEARLAQVETLLKSQDEPSAAGNHTPSGQNGVRKANGAANDAQQPQPSQDAMATDFVDMAAGRSNVETLSYNERTINQHEGSAQPPLSQTIPNAAGIGGPNLPSEDGFPWEMIGLGLDEPLPVQEVVNELTQAFFEKVHPFIPMIHPPRYYAAMNLPPHLRPPVCLRYAMWAHAAAVMDKYDSLQDHFYQRSRKYIQQDEMRGHGESMITVAHSQTWILLASYEFKMMFFPRAWMSSGRGSRMVQMMGLHRLDGTGLDVKQCVPPPKDWTEREERRRTFWMSFCVDRYSSIGTGWPMVIEEKDIMTNMPVDEESFELSKPRKTMCLNEALDPSGASALSSYGGVIVMATLFGRNLTHLHRPGPNDNDDDLNGDFWKRHRAMDSILLNTALALPDPLRMPHGLNDPNIVFLNMNIHTSTICLHQAAIFKADRNRMPARISAESKVRCITAAAEIASIMRMISHLDLSSMNPFISFCLYVAARVFIQYLKSRPKDVQVRTSLQFLLTAMHAVKRKNPLTESFLVQLDVDLESAGLEDARSVRSSVPKQTQTANRSPGCPFDHLGLENMTEGGRPTYGDNGLAVYNQPDSQTVPQVPPGSMHPETLSANGQDTNGNPYSNFLNNPHQFQLPTREQRSPGSMYTLSDSAQHRSPANTGPEMDTSPDCSGSGSGCGNDQLTPGSQQQNSSRTSNTGYSPHNPPDHQPNNPNSQANIPLNAAFFEPTDTFTSDFNMHTMPLSNEEQQQQGFVLPQSWDPGAGRTGTGLTPGISTGFTPGPSGSTGFTPGPNGDVLGMSDMEWNQVLEGLGDWEPNITTAD